MTRTFSGWRGMTPDEAGRIRLVYSQRLLFNVLMNSTYCGYICVIATENKIEKAKALETRC